MKQLMRRGFAWLLVLVLMIGMLPGISFAAHAAGSIVDYQYVDVSSKYTGVIKNWGTRGELATFLSPNAEAFYGDTTLESLAALAGSSDVSTVTSSELYSALQTLMAEAHTTKNSYNDSRDLFAYTDSQENGAQTTQISAFYSGSLVGPAWDSGKTWNREHTWPNSKSGDTDEADHEDDIMMLRPEAGNVNSSRSNKAYGVSEGYFEPNMGTMNVRGDVARIMLYSYVRWGSEAITETKTVDDVKTVTEKVLSDNMWGTDGVIESVDVLLAWMAEDPVDTWEMARNDSVQSITGTRNVFVDYPELAFELFEAEIPEGYDSPSGSANDCAFTITAGVNNANGGEVSVNGNYVTAHPYAGYQVAGITVSEGVTYTKNGDVYTINASADCTVTVNFAELDSYTVQIVENGKVVSSAEYYDGNIVALPEFSGTLPENYNFVGWVADALASDTSAKPAAIYPAGAELTVDDDYSYHALLAYLNTEDTSGATLTYELVDSAEDLIIGNKYVIAAAEYDYALGNVQGKNNRPAVAINKNGSILGFDDAAGVAELVLGAGIEITEPEATEPPATEPPATEPPATEPAATEPGTVEPAGYVKVTSADQFVSGQYVMIVDTGYAPLKLDGTWVTCAQPTVDGDVVTDTASAVWTLTVDGSSVTMTDSNGVSIKPKSGNNNGIQSGSYKWAWSFANGLFTFKGTGSDTTTFTSNSTTGSSGGLNRFRSYKNTTVTNTTNYHSTFTLYKLTGAATKAEVKAATKAASTPTYTFYDATEANAGYLYAASSGSNYLRTQADVDANASFAITVNGDGTCTLIAQGANTRNNLRYNTQSTIFSCYASGQQAVALYVGVAGGGTMYYATSWETDEVPTTTDWEAEIDPTDPPATEPEVTTCPHSATTTTTVDATCTTDGSITVTCNACGEVISTEVIAAGHKIVDGVCSVCNLVTAPKAGVAYQMVVAQNKLGKTLYATGAISGFYLSTSEAEAEAGEFFLEAVDGVDGAFRMYVMADGVKTYVSFHERTDKAGSGTLELVTSAPETYYTFNTTFNTLVNTNATSGNSFYIGCYNSYNTISASNLSYMSESNVDVSQFPTRLYAVPAVEAEVTAADGVNKLENDIKLTYNGITLPETVTVADVVMNVAWAIEASDANAAKIENGVLVIAPQAAAATYTLTATVSNGESDTATATWTGKVVPTSAAIEDGTYVLWIDGNAVTTIASGYAYLPATSGIALGETGLTGHVKENIFTLTANGDGTYSIVDANGNYLYSDMSYVNSTQINVGAKPAHGATWTIVASDSSYFVYNVDRAAALSFSASYSNFALYGSESSQTALTLTAVDPCLHTNVTTTTVDPTCTEDGSKTVSCDECGMTISTEVLEATGHTYENGSCVSCGEAEPAPTTSATISFATLDQRTEFSTEAQVWQNAGATLTNNKGASSSAVANYSNPVRFYKSSDLIIAFPGMNKIEITCSESKYVTALTGSIADANATVTTDGLVVTIELAEAADEYTITLTGGQVRVKELTVYAPAASEACVHTNTTTTTVDSTCTAHGSVTVTCNDCGETVSTEELPLADHSYDEGVVTAPTTTTGGYTTYTCTACGHSYQDNIKNPLPAELKFRTWSLTLKSDLTVNFQVEAAVYNAYENMRAEFTIVDGVEEHETVVVTEAVLLSNGRYSFQFAGVAPYRLKDTIQAKLYGTFEGVEYVIEKQYQVVKYCQALMPSGGVVGTVAVNLVNFATMQQIYMSHNTNDLINSDLTDDQKAMGTYGQPTWENKLTTKHVVIDNPTAAFKGVTLDVQSIIRMRFTVQLPEDTTGIVAYITADNGAVLEVPFEEFEPTGTANRYYIYFSGMRAVDMRKCAYVCIKQNGTVISNTLRYSIESYCATSYVAGTNLGNLLEAMINYGDAVEKY